MAHSPWGDLQIADAHVHFFSHSFYSALARQRNLDSAEALSPVLNWSIPASDQEVAAQWIAELDRQGVSRACLIASLPGDEASVSQAVSLYPERFYGYAIFDPLQPGALDRMNAIALNPNLHAICLFPAMHTYSITDSKLVPLLEIASDRRLVVFVHCGAISVGVRKKLGLPNQFDLRYSNPLDLHPVALHFPEIRFVIPHFGAGMFREALMLADLCPNVYLDTSSSNRWVMYEGLDVRSVFRRAIDLLGPQRLLFGTDSSFFPRGWHAAIFETQAKAVYELGLEQSEAEQIFRLNVESLLQPRSAWASSHSKSER